MLIEIDNGSGFCFGVTTAIKKAEEELAKAPADGTSGIESNSSDGTSGIESNSSDGTSGIESKPVLYCLGDIVHNGMEVERLAAKGLVTINHAQLKSLHHVKVLLRAHGEPPETYEIARRNHIEIIDATCPVVLQLQRRIKKQYERSQSMNNVSSTCDSKTNVSSIGESKINVSSTGVTSPQIVIFGKNGHAEVLGLVGQTQNTAIVIEHFDEVSKLDFTRDIYLYSQTTKSLDEFHQIIAYIQQHIASGAVFKSFDTICRQVANRMPNIAIFAARHDVVLFVCGRKSSNGKVLYNECKSVNARSYQIESANEIDMSWLSDVRSVGICGATSTPKWLMEECRDYILSHQPAMG